MPPGNRIRVRSAVSGPAGASHIRRVSGSGAADEAGTLEPGKLADILILDGDPTTDIRALLRTKLVIIGGKADAPAMPAYE